MTRKPLSLATAALVLMLPILCAASEEEPPYKWTCKAQGFFEMNVAPDGTASPIVDTTTPIDPISIVIERRANAAQVERPFPFNMTFPLDDQYIVGFTGKDVGPFLGEMNDLEASSAKLTFGKQGLEKVVAVYFRGDQPSVATLKTADKDWVFSVYSGLMTTDSEARHMNIIFPPNVPRLVANSSVFQMTGPCVRDR